jgi:glycerol-1-phosphatase
VAEGAQLAAGFRGVVLDLDGVVYLGEQAIPAAPAALEGVRGLGVGVAFVTNNSYRPPDLVTQKLNRLGVKAATDEVLTSAQAAVRLLGGRAGLEGVGVLVVGGPGLRGALEAAGARLVDARDWRDAQVVAVGFDPDLTYDKARTAALAIRAGARFVGSNPDATLPTLEGLWPGAGATLAMLQAATGVRPEVAGKPERALLDTAAAAIGPGPYLMVGDRADTDLDGAHRLGWATALVLSGVTRPADLPDLTLAPDHLLADVGGLLDPPGPAIRAATPAETAEATRLLARARAAPGHRDATDSTTAQAPTLVAVDGDRVVGAVALRPEGEQGIPDAGPAGGTPDPVPKRRAGLLVGPVVEEGLRGRLVGTRLLMAACIQARAAGLGRVAAGPGAEGFLTRLGFRPAGAGAPGRLVRDLR